MRIPFYGDVMTEPGWEAQVGRNIRSRHIDPVIKAVGPYGKAAAAATALWAGGRFVAYPLLSGSIDPELREKIGNNPVGHFFTGQDPNSQNLQAAIYDKKAEEYKQELLDYQAEQRLQAEKDYRRKAEYDQSMAREQALWESEIGLATGGAQTFRNVLAKELANSTANYLDSMQIANDRMKLIFGYRAPVI